MHLYSRLRKKFSTLSTSTSIEADCSFSERSSNISVKSQRASLSRASENIAYYQHKQLLQSGGSCYTSYASLPPPAKVLEEWSFPSHSPGVRGSGRLQRFFTRQPVHAAAKPSTLVGNDAYFGATGSLNCGCSDSSTRNSTGSGVASRNFRASGEFHNHLGNSSFVDLSCCCCSRRLHGCDTFMSPRPDSALQSVMNVPTLIQEGDIRCLILDSPSNANLPAYIAEMQRFGVTDLVRTCDCSYDDSAILAAGIRVHELVFADGESPPQRVVEEWLSLVKSVSTTKGGTIGVHCVAGLGRAPVLVALALIDRGMNPEDAVAYIRSRRKGAINRRQLQFVSRYRPRDVSSFAAKRCIRPCGIMKRL